MAIERTISIVKPDAVGKNVIGKIYSRFEENGLRIVAAKMKHLSVRELNEYYIGQLIYFFEIGCGISGNVLGVNPFNQPGVEAYKKNMFALLDKPGYEAESKAIKERLK